MEGCNTHDNTHVTQRQWQFQLAYILAYTIISTDLNEKKWRNPTAHLEGVLLVSETSTLIASIDGTAYKQIGD